LMVLAAVPAIDTSPPRRGEECITLHNSRLRKRSALDSNEAGVLSTGERVKVIDVHHIDAPDGPYRMLVEARRGNQVLRGWLSHLAKTGEVLVEARHDTPGAPRRPRWNFVTDYCASCTRVADGSFELSDQPPQSNSMDFVFPNGCDQLGRAHAEWDGQFQFVRTLESGDRQYGFCSRLRRADGRVEACVYCTRYPWFAFWRRLLLQLDATRRVEDALLTRAQQMAKVGDVVEVFRTTHASQRCAHASCEPDSHTR
jgi:hypothetical protein